MNAIMNAIGNFLGRFKAAPESDSESNSNSESGGDGKGSARSSDSLTNEGLLRELTSHFKTMLLDESVGQKMLYPMSFNVLMDPADYEARRQSFPFVLPEVVSAFYGIIEEMRSKYPNYTPPARYWYFQFAASQTNRVQTDDSAPLLVRRGHISTVASLMAFDIRNAAGNLSVDSNTRVSMKLDDSNVMNEVNVNKAAIGSIDIISDGTFTYNFDMSLGRDTRSITASTNLLGLAELSYSRGGRTYHYTMVDNLVYLSGKSESRRGSMFFVIEEENIRNSHIQIRYLPEEKRFQIAAFGPARLNSGRMNESSGGNVVWYDLSNNSSIFINDIISVKFEIK